jgi:hypothetical protein
MMMMTMIMMVVVVVVVVQVVQVVGHMAVTRRDMKDALQTAPWHGSWGMLSRAAQYAGHNSTSRSRDMRDLVAHTASPVAKSCSAEVAGLWCSRYFGVSSTSGFL